MKIQSVIYKIICYLFFIPLLLLFINVWWTFMIFFLILTVILYHFLDNKKWLFLQILLLIITYFVFIYFDFSVKYFNFFTLLSFAFLIFQPLFLSLKDNKLKSIKVPYFIYGYELHILTPPIIIASIILLCMILEFKFSIVWVLLLSLFLLFVYWKYYFLNKWETLREHLIFNYILVIPVVIFVFILSLDFSMDWMWSFIFIVLSTISYLYLFLFNILTFLLYLYNDEDDNPTFRLK